jgi:V-type H+-transporting ATPase S1 subunit
MYSPFICLGIVGGIFVLFSAVSAVKVQSIADAKEAFYSRYERASGSDPSSNLNSIVLSNDSLVFNHSCILMEVEMIKIWARPQGSVSLILDQDISRSTYVVSGPDCFNSLVNGSAAMTVTFSNIANSTISSASFTMTFTKDYFNWFLTGLNMDVTYTNKTGTITVNNITLSTEDLFASNDASYYCKEPTITNFVTPIPFTDPASQYGLMFGEVIFQPFLNSTGDTFSPVEPCEYAFTIGLWMAVISGLTMLIILFFGVTMLESIRTMDRFDDPKTSKLLSVPSE